MQLRHLGVNRLVIIGCEFGIKNMEDCYEISNKIATFVNPLRMKSLHLQVFLFLLQVRYKIKFKVLKALYYFLT